MAISGNTQRCNKNWPKLEYTASGLVDCCVVLMNNASKLFRNVIAIMGKLADNVNTGNSAKKYSMNTRKRSDCLAVGIKFNVYKSSSCTNANDPVIARNK